MFTTRARQGTHPLLGARNATARLRRSVAVLAALIVGLLASAATVPAAFAMIPDPGDAPGSAGVAPVQAPAVRVVVTGGMAGWQITSIALGAACWLPQQPYSSTGPLPSAGSASAAGTLPMLDADARSGMSIWRAGNHGPA